MHKSNEGKGQLAQFKDGNLRCLFTIANGSIEGPIQFFHPDGSLHYTYTLKDGKKNGEEWEYYPQEKEGDLQLVAKLCLHWNEDKIQGQVKTWYPNGQIESQREIHENKKQGTCFAWYKNGDLMLVEEYENDLLVKGSYYKKGIKKRRAKSNQAQDWPFFTQARAFSSKKSLTKKEGL